MQAKGKVLIVDDEANVREVIRRVLTRHGLQCCTAADAREAVAAAATESPILTIVDIHMRGRDGVWLLEELKERWPDMAVIMLTGDTNPRTAVDCLKKGAVDYLVKPIDLDELGISVLRAIERVRLVRENREYHHNLERKVKERTTQLRQALEFVEETYHSTLEALVNADRLDGPASERNLSALEPSVEDPDLDSDSRLPSASATAGKLAGPGVAEGIESQQAPYLAALRSAGELIGQGASPIEVATAIATELVEGGGVHSARLWLGREAKEREIVVEKVAGAGGACRAEGGVHPGDATEKREDPTSVRVPILVRGRGEGVLEIGWKEGCCADPVALTERLALFVAASLARKRGATDLRHVAHSLMDSLHEVVDYDVAGLLLIDEPASLEIQTPFAADEEFITRVRTHILNAFRHNCGLEVRSDIDCRVSRLVTPEVQPQEAPPKQRTYVDVPLSVGEGVAGLIHLSKGRENGFSQLDVLHLNRLASLFATSV